MKKEVELPPKKVSRGHKVGPLLPPDAKILYYSKRLVALIYATKLFIAMCLKSSGSTFGDPKYKLLILYVTVYSKQ